MKNQGNLTLRIQTELPSFKSCLLPIFSTNKSLHYFYALIIIFLVSSFSIGRTMQLEVNSGDTYTVNGVEERVRVRKRTQWCYTD
ncbi:hypothetical protein [Candidatus Odyssella acanthamoebae]|uniref:hypothetical protein n=1 Tax=Candidatus Odyssella acanthamoebae TaxID=91604 RepID=UPI0012EB9915|nr:hypothetical protein [Candidatus Paracaedibacter acanthamoebae]